MGQCACAAPKKLHQNKGNHELTEKRGKSSFRMPEILPAQFNYQSLFDLQSKGFSLSGPLINKIQETLKEQKYMKYLQIGNCYFLQKDYFKAFQSFLKSISENKDQVYTGFGNKEEKIGLYEGRIASWYMQQVKSEDFVESAWNGLSVSVLECVGEQQTIIKELNQIKQNSQFQVNTITGHLLYNTGKFEESLRCYQQSQLLKKQNIFVLLGIGHCLYKLKRQEEAEEYYDKVLAINPLCAYAFMGKAKIVVRSQKQGEYYEKASQCDPTYARPFNSLGNLYSEKKQYFQAIFHYKKSIQKNSNYFSPYYGMAIANKCLKKNQQAIETFQKCIDLDPKHFDSYINLGNLYRNIKDFQRAIQNYESALKLNPNSQIAQNGLGNVYTVMKDHPKAIQCYLKCIEINPNHHSQYNGLGNVYSEMEKYQQAIKYYKKALEVNPKNSTPYNGLGIAYSSINNYQQAIEAYKKCIQLNPKYEIAYNGLGNVYKKLKRYDEAIKCYNSAIDLKQDYSSPHNGLGNVYKELREFHKAIKCYSACIILNPNNPLFDLNLAMAYIEIENYGQAFQTFKICEQKLKNAHSLQRVHIEFIETSLQKFTKEAEEWQYRIKIGFVTDEQKQRIRQMKDQFEKRYEKLFSSDSQRNTLDPQTVLDPRFLKVCRLVHKNVWDQDNFAEMAGQIFGIFKLNHETFEIMAQILCNYFWMKKFIEKEQTTHEIQHELAQIMKHLSKQFSPTEERPPIQGIQFPTQSEKKINLFTETQFFTSYQGIVNQIEKINNKGKQIKPKFAKLVYDTQKECNGLNCKVGLKLPDSPEKWFKVIIRIMEKMFKEIKNQKENLMQEIQAKIEKEEKAPMIRIVKIIMEVWISKIDQILKKRKKEKVPTECYLSDLVRGKCIFKTPEEIKEACDFLIKLCSEEGYEITEIDNRINKVTHDIVFKILIDGIVCELQLDIEFEEDKFEYGHSFYEIQRSPLGCIFGSYLILSKGTSYSFYSRVNDALDLLKSRQEDDEVRIENLEALQFVKSVLGQSNGQK